MTDWPANMPKPTWESKDGSVLLYHGDNRDLLPAIEAARVEGLAVVTDPPYGIADKWVGGAGGASSWRIAATETHAWDQETPVETVCALPRLGECVIWGGNYYPLPPSRCWFVWDKCQPDTWTTGQCELAWTNLDRPVRAFRMCQAVAHDEMRPKLHPTQKPQSLMAWCLKWVVGKTVFDPFVGSGSTAVACVASHRRCVGVERRPDYFDIAVRRIEEAFDSQALFRQDEQREPDPELFEAANDSAKNVAVPESSLDSNERAKA